MTLNLKVRFGYFLTTRRYDYSQIVFFRCVDFSSKLFILMNPFLGNLTTHITIANNAVGESGAIIMDFSHFTFAETSDKQDSDDANVVQPSAKIQQPAVSTVLITPSIPEIIWAKNVKAIVVCRFLMKSLKKHILKIWKKIGCRLGITC
mgnify:CR=1 FL=1